MSKSYSPGRLTSFDAGGALGQLVRATIGGKASDFGALLDELELMIAGALEELELMIAGALEELELMIAMELELGMLALLLTLTGLLLDGAGEFGGPQAITLPITIESNAQRGVFFIFNYHFQFV